LNQHQIWLNGRFIVKEGSPDRLTLAYEAQGGPTVTISLKTGISLPEAKRTASWMNRRTDAVVLDFKYSSAGNLGLRPAVPCLEDIRRELHQAIYELIDRRDYSEAERRLRIVDKLAVELISRHNERGSNGE
jgi:hypothetical protein